MIALCVDDERIPLSFLKMTVERSDKISQAVAFDNEEEALEWANTHSFDVAFLDIELHAMNGLELAKELLRIRPGISIVFSTSYEQYAVRAMKMHIDAGYLMKPFRPEQIREEIDYIASKRAESPKLRVECFGDFEAYVGDKPLDFKRKMSKELLAYLIDRRGATVSTNQICAVFWGDAGSDEKKKDYMYHLISDLRKTLEDAGIKDVFLSQRSGYAINAMNVDCDYYKMLNGDPQAVRLYTGEYMQQYSWSEVTNSWLVSQFMR